MTINLWQKHKAMKKYLLLILCFAVSLSTMSANTEKQYKQYIEKYDVANEAKSVSNNSPTDFWRAMLDNNELFFKFARDLKKKRGAEKEALRKTDNLPRFYPQYDRSVVESMQGFCDTLLINMGIRDLPIKCSLHVVYSDEPNAFCALTEEGFAMCLTSGLFSLRGINYHMLMGYVAHEFVHGALKHQMRSFYADAKERRRNKLIGGIAIGLTAAAAGLETYNAAAYGIPPSGTDYEAVINNIETEVKVSTLRYSFKYSREQEIEAALIAFRFLENLGYGEDFINSLRILGTDYDALYSDYSDHPTISYRIRFIKFVQQNPGLGNKCNTKLRKERIPPVVVESVEDDTANG